MTEVRKIDELATRSARIRQAAGIEALNEMFAITPLKFMLAGMDKHTGKLRPVRMHPNTPPVRPDKEARRKRMRRKMAHESRRRNRSRG